jgi:filamin
VFYTGVFLDSPTGFTVDAKSVAPTGDGKVRAIVTSPSGQRTESLVKNNNDGTYDVLYTPYEQGMLYCSYKKNLLLFNMLLLNF